MTCTGANTFDTTHTCKGQFYSVSSTVAPRKSLNASLIFVKNLEGEATCDHFSYVEYIPEKWEVKTFFEKN